MKLSRIITGTLACAVALAAAARAQAPVMDVGAIPEYDAVQPGGTFRVALRLEVPEGWHIYWTNPGTSGLPTTLAWQVPADVSAGATEWPYPETDDAGDDVTNVYRGTVVAFSTFTVAPGASGRLALAAHLVWGLCRVQCVRQERTVTVTVAVSTRVQQRSADWAAAEAASRFLPMRERGATFTATARGDSVRLVLAGLKAGPAPGSWVTYFPLQPGLPSMVAPVRSIEGAVTVTLPHGAAGDSTALRLTGVLVAAHAPGSPPPVRAIAVDVPVTR